MHRNIGNVKKLLSATYSSWNAHNAPRLGAALAYYTLLSVAPLAILVVAICGVVLNRTTAEYQVLSQTRQLLGSNAAATLKQLIDNTQHRNTGILATVVAFVTLFFGASGVFLELRSSLNTIWDAPAVQTSAVWSVVKDRLASFAMVAGLGIFLLTSLLVTTVFGILEKFATGLLPVPAAVSEEILNFLISLVTLGVLFALVYKLIPNVPVRWRDVGVGAGVTAALFTIGKTLLALYLTTAGVGSAYGAAGSLVAFVVWIYYSAQIFFFGAVFTRVYAEQANRFSAGRTPTQPDKRFSARR